MAISSYYRYTTIGFDFEEAQKDQVLTTYYRIRWDDGSFWIGQEIPTFDKYHTETELT